MKTTLPERSLIIKTRLDKIVPVILDAAKDKIAMIILFGSYARGDWVEDDYVKDHVNYVYQSDLDIMLVMKKGKYAGIYETIKIEKKIQKLLDFLRLDGPIDSNYRGKPYITMIFESIESVRKGCERNHYFYADIKKEGVILYTSGEFEFPDPKELTCEEWKEMAEDDYNQWFPRGCEFLIDCKNCVERGNYNKAAFELHQATESFYNAILLVFTGYKPKLHDLEKLKGLTSQYDQELLKVFPLFDADQAECFKLLKKAYVDARYEKSYKITEEQLSYLIERVEYLKKITERICKVKLGA